MALDRAAIMAANHWDIKAVAVPDWHGAVNIRNLDGREGSRLVKLATDDTLDDVDKCISAIVASV